MITAIVGASFLSKTCWHAGSRVALLCFLPRLAIPRGLIQARNVLANLGKKHNKATLEPACQQVLDKKLAPTMAVIKTKVSKETKKVII